MIILGIKNLQLIVINFQSMSPPASVYQNAGP